MKLISPGGPQHWMGVSLHFDRQCTVNASNGNVASIVARVPNFRVLVETRIPESGPQENRELVPAHILNFWLIRSSVAVCVPELKPHLKLRCTKFGIETSQVFRDKRHTVRCGCRCAALQCCDDP